MNIRFIKLAFLAIVGFNLTGCLFVSPEHKQRYEEGMAKYNAERQQKKQERNIEFEQNKINKEARLKIEQEKREQARQAKIKEQQKEFQEIRAIPTCSSERECKTKWDAAQLWVAKNADFKIRIANDVMIETFSSLNKDTAHDSYVIITKEPLGDGKYLIKPMIKCESRLFCFKSSDEQKRKFNNYVNSFN